MDKVRFKAGSPVLGQLLSMIPRDQFGVIVQSVGSDRYVKKFRSWDHLVVMLYGTIQRVGGLRELCSGLAAHNTTLKHFGMGCLPKRSTLSDANAKRDPAVFQELFKALYTRYASFLPDSPSKEERWLSRLLLIDSTTITLFKDVMKACGRTPANGRKKGGVKVHVGMWLRENVASMVTITPAAANDRSFMPEFRNVEKGTILVFDKAYLHYKLFIHWTLNQVSFVTRLHNRSVVTLLSKKQVSRVDNQLGVLDDDIVELGHQDSQDKVLCRRIRFYDKDKGIILRFISNNMELSPYQIAQIYKQRWQIEMLFKRLKQNLKLTDFLGDSENAIRIQIWCALISDLLVALVRNAVQKTKRIAFSNVYGLLRLHLTHYVLISQLLNSPEDPSIFSKSPPSPLSLFSTPP